MTGRRTLPLVWTLRPVDCADCEGGGCDSCRVPAVVPGTVQSDWARARQLGDPNLGRNWRDYSGLEDRSWRYETLVDAEEVGLTAGESVFLVVRGVDYSADLLIGGTVVASWMGLHRVREVCLDPYLAGGSTSVTVQLHPAPKAIGEQTWGEKWAAEKRGEARTSTKPSISYGEDFHPRLIPLGLWNGAFLEIRPAARIVDHHVEYVCLDGDQIQLRVSAHARRPDAGEIRVRLLDDEGAPLLALPLALGPDDGYAADAVVSVRRWWPVGEGDQPLYTCAVEVVDGAGRVVDRVSTRLGFRTARLVMHEGAWELPPGDLFPKTRSNPPMTLELNGQPVFARGASVVPPRILYGEASRSDYQALVGRALEANLNLLRISGGGVAFKSEFYEECDRAGIMVWQDFPLSCNLYPDDRAYLSLLESEARAIIDNLRTHPSVVLWCGGNELFEFHSGMTEQAAALRLLGALTYDLDPHRPFIMSSPLMGIGHGPYELLHEVDGNWRDGPDLMSESHHTAYPELACPSVAPIEVLRRIIPESDLYPPRADTAWEDHGAFNAFASKFDSWLDQDALRRIVGPWSSLEELVSLSQCTQANVVKLLIETARRKAPMTSLANVWVLNEPWPTAANLSLVAWPDVPKPALTAVGAANRRRLLSVELPKMVYRPGETVTLRLWLLNLDRGGAGTVGPVRLELSDDTDPGVAPLFAWAGELETETVATNLMDRRKHMFTLPSDRARGRYRVVVSCAGRTELTSEYLLFVSSDL